MAVGVKYRTIGHGNDGQGGYQSEASHRVPPKWNATRAHRAKAAANRARRRNNGRN